MNGIKSANNHMHTDGKKRRSFLALLFTAGEVRRYKYKTTLSQKEYFGNYRKNKL